MRAGIVTCLEPLVEGEDAFSGTVMHMIKRTLQRCDVVDLTNVLLTARDFLTEMDPYLHEYVNLRNQALAEAGQIIGATAATEGDALSTDPGNDDPESGGEGY
jgi:hypothetical protein